MKIPPGFQIRNARGARDEPDLRIDRKEKGQKAAVGAVVMGQEKITDRRGIDAQAAKP
jgi:hypothetical protein